MKQGLETIISGVPGQVKAFAEIDINDSEL
jgi:hypothetical protein